MTWQSVAAFLACARIGAVHSVVFAGFSSESLRDRVLDCKSRVVLTSDEGRRGGKSVATKLIVDAALKECPLVEHVLVLQRTGNQVPWTEGRDKWWHEETAKVPNYCPPEIMASEDPLFILYVSAFFHVVCSFLMLHPYLDFWINRKTQGRRSYHWRIPPRRGPYRKIRFRCSPR
jgi:acetyl-CoA synthetase